MFIVQNNLRSWFIYFVFLSVLAGILHGNTPELLLDTDDRDYLAEAAISITDLSRLFSADRRPSATGRPVIDVVFLVDYALWGTDHVFYHYQVVVVHLAASLLVALVSYRLGTSLLSAFLGGLFFLVHVAHFRAVHWIASIAYPLSFVFGFATVCFHHHFLNGRRWGQYAAAASLGMAVLSHPASISILPFCLYISWRRIQSFFETIKMSWQLGAIAFLCMAICYGLYPQSTQVAAVDTSFDFGLVAETLTWYLSRLIMAPHWLWVDLHPQPTVWELVVGAMGYAGLFFLWWRGPEPIRIFAVWTVIAILPFYNAKPGFRWTPAGPSRHLYFSAAGTSLILAYFIVWAGERLEFWVGRSRAVGVLICTFVGIVGISIYNNWRTQAISYYASGRTYFAQQEIELGIMQLEKAIKRSPEVVPLDTYRRQALMFFSYNRSPESPLRIGRDLYPNNVNLMFIEGFWQSQQTDLEVQRIGQEKMERALKIAVDQTALKHNAAVACHNLAGYFNNQGDFNRAISLYRQALVFNPQYVLAARNLGLALRNAKKNDEALDVFQQVIALDSEHEDAYKYISEILFQRGHFEAAQRVAELILQFSPESINAHYSVAIALHAQGNFEKAVQYYKKVLELAPEHDKAKKALQVLIP